ncbi:pectinesterase family protein [Clostridium cellulovorans]|uniref:Pectinesterase n=2 Tax=Clostridium cellulovorans TaxID=1493 RepID=D9SW33_CLOC7|nr:pectinesterase family protein [Clostridium cellulovorans]ADL51177.1 Pectinesterase [Clostridium cellulovorans 743B]BAV13196.1 pectin methylesterase [Clostridium cellulovorans]
MIVCKDGSGDFKTIQEAINSIPDNSNEKVTIYIKDGVYKEKLHITKPYVILIGESTEKTIITFDDYANKLFPNGEKYRTFNSYTVFISGDNFTAQNITIENSAGSGDVVGQAVALYVDSDKAIFKKCKFLGQQDTIFTGPLPPKPIEGNDFGGPMEGKPRRNVRQYFEQCYIEGDIDFIFGSSTVVFNKCEVFSLDKDKPINGYITAASTPEGLDFGYVFIDCKLTSNAKKETVYLGRPWRDYAKTAFINCYMGKHIINEGWHNWDKKQAENLVSYVEYNSYGPGATLDKRAQWTKVLSRESVAIYSISNVLSGNDNWNPIDSSCEV